MNKNVMENSQYARLAGMVGLEEKTFDLVNPFVIKTKEGELVINNYTIKKMGAKAEKLMISAIFDQKSKVTLFDAILNMIIRVNDETKVNLIKTYIKRLPACEMEAIRYNFRVFNYGSDLSYAVSCEGKDSNGEECGHTEDVDFDLTDFSIAKQSVPENKSYDLNDKVKINLKRILDTQIELERLEKIPPKVRERYSREIERLILIDSVDMDCGNGEIVNLPFGVDQLLNERGMFVATNNDVKSMLQFLGSITADDYSRMLDINKEVQEFSYYDLDGEYTCSECGHLNQFKIDTRMAHFLLQLGKITETQNDSEE